MGKPIPEGWLDYTPVGKQIPGTRFISFKVPLTTNLGEVDEENRLNPDLLLKQIPNLGLIIDLTDTYRYYNPEIFKSYGVEHIKIRIPGRILPPDATHLKFKTIVSEFLAANAENERLIGVHCTHGCNRTGLMICSYLVKYCSISPVEALTRFQIARGHEITRENYVLFLNEIESEQPLPSETLQANEKCTQTSTGYWIPQEQFIRKRKLNVTCDERPHSQVNVRGIVNVNAADLIPDGKGGYFIHINSDTPVANKSAHNPVNYSANPPSNNWRDKGPQDPYSWRRPATDMYPDLSRRPDTSKFPRHDGSRNVSGGVDLGRSNRYQHSEQPKSRERQRNKYDEDLSQRESHKKKRR